MDKNFQKNPYNTYQTVHSSNSVLWDENLKAYFLGQYEDVNAILKDNHFTTAPLAVRAEPVMGDRVLAQMEGDEHPSKRQAILSKLTGKMFRTRYASIIEKTIDQLLTPHLGKGKIDIINEFGKDYSVLVTLMVLGLPIDRYKDIAMWHKGIASFVTSLNQSDEDKEFSLSCSKNIISYLTPLIEEWDKNSSEDLISVLCKKTNDGNSMTTSEIVALVLNMLLAAIEPADKTLAYLFYHLLTNPDKLKKIQNDRTLLGDAIAETLRLTSPVQLIPRQTNQAIEFRGISLPANSLVFCMIGAANRDPDVFMEPNNFIPERKRVGKTGEKLIKTANHLAFGAGMHVCVGAAFALMQIELTANKLLDKLIEINLINGFVLEEEGLYTRGPSALPITFIPIAQSSQTDIHSQSL
ncbi:cytochrome P450, cyclodipeptide synthase-associated [Bartonella raoultii]|uniref:Cytochrome P450, cyclodipeptide synthase-associated n=1 Tax=Bartonella raoultii TaxID=1457020 RepID=A0ABS7I3D5_9HYPH|nr:cytochrome P450, cyclodipeptide synthase-associated [Bartonella raoultii]MBX4335164.1 cytochrome P450, cyclodipeptide synthase-associated [Bartonella raoultii]